jgi:ParB family chromosome partitioning protein
MEIMAGQMTVRQAERRSPIKAKSSGKLPKDPNLTDLETSISNKLGLKVQIIHKGDKGGEVRIGYSSLEQLEEITRRLNRS